MSIFESFQYVDAMRALNTNRFANCNPTGSGKTYWICFLIEHLRQLKEINKVIILTSPVGTLNLKAELLKMGANQKAEEIFVISSLGEVKDRAIFNRPEKTFIMSYDAFRAINDYYDKIKHNRKKKTAYKKSALPLEIWLENYKGIIFLDECHHLGNPFSLRSHAININLKYFEYRYLSTATLCDKKEKIYMPLKILDKSLISGLGYYAWLSQYVTLGNKWRKYGINESTWNLQKWAELQDVLYKDYAVKRPKSILGLKPEVDMPVIQVDMSPSHRAIYEAFSNEVVSKINQNVNLATHRALNHVMAFANLFPYAMLGVNNPKCLEDSKNFINFPPRLQSMIRQFNFQKDFTKLNVLDKIIQEECVENDNKIVVFYYHPKTKDELVKHLPSAFVVSADIEKENRFPIIESFKKSKEKIIIMSINIANTSFSLIEAKAMVFFENTFNYTDYFQARGRITRIGQEEETRYYQILYRDSLNALELKNLQTKGQTMDNLIKKNLLSPEEWKLIFNGNAND
jgi:hypothetical protein